MNNKFSNQINKYWKRLNKEKLNMCPSLSFFRILSQNKIKISKICSNSILNLIFVLTTIERLMMSTQPYYICILVEFSVL